MNPLEARRRLLGRNVYKRTTEGNPAIAQGSLARRYPGIAMQGWTEQPQYEGKNLFDISKFQSGTTNINNGDGSITLTAYIANINNKISDVLPDVKTGDVLYTSATNGTFIYIGGKVVDINQNKSIEITDEVLENNAFGFYGSNDGEITISDIMISKAYETPYEPYTGDAPSPSPDYPQEIVSAGTYNEDTQKWEYEITIANEQTDPDKNQTVTLTSDRPLTKWDKLEKRNGQWGWVYKSNEVVLDGSKDENWIYQLDSNKKQQFYISLSDALYPYSEPFKEMFYCDIFMTTNNSGAISKWQVRKGDYRGLAPVFKPSDDIDTAEAFRDFLAENQTTILYVTKEETFIPLPESEQEQMNALHTFRPTTVLSNDCDCNMTLTYKTKKSMGGG